MYLYRTPGEQWRGLLVATGLYSRRQAAPQRAACVRPRFGAACKACGIVVAGEGSGEGGTPPASRNHPNAKFKGPVASARRSESQSESEVVLAMHARGGGRVGGDDVSRLQAAQLSCSPCCCGHHSLTHAYGWAVASERRRAS